MLSGALPLQVGLSLTRALEQDISGFILISEFIPGASTAVTRSSCALSLGESMRMRGEVGKGMKPDPAFRRSSGKRRKREKLVDELVPVPLA